mgnify:CR=1 FL=1
MILLIQTPTDSSKNLLYSWIMSFIESLLTCYKKTFNYSDRASKSEYYWFTLYAYIIQVLVVVYHKNILFFYAGIIFYHLDSTTPLSFNLSQLFSTIEIIFGAILLFPLAAIFIVLSISNGLAWFAVCVRRSHDMDRSVVWPTLIILIPVFGFFIMPLFHVGDGSKGRNRFGPKPRK